MMSGDAGKILAIVKKSDIAGRLGYFIGNLGYEYHTVDSGANGLAEVQTWHPDLIILDLHLADITGMEILRRLKENHEFSDIPVVLLSEEESEEISVVALSGGASDLISAPISMGKLMATVQNNLELARSRRELRELNRKLEKEKKHLLKYFSADIVEKILNEEISTELGGSKMSASILFFDLRGSTRIAESLDPMVFADLISLIFSSVMDLIFAHHGSVNKLLGDGILAVFGCPQPHPADTHNSLQCALAIRHYFKVFNNELPAYIDEPVSCGIGLARGMVFAGNVGSVRRMEYTVLGYPVNLAARLQALTWENQCDILLDENTWKELGIECQRDMVRVGNMEIRGMTYPGDIFCLKGR